MSPPPTWTRRGTLSAGVDSNSRIFIPIASRVPYLQHAPWTRRGTLSAGVDACAPAWPGRPTAAAACRAAAATHMNSVRRLVTAARGQAQPAQRQLPIRQLCLLWTSAEGWLSSRATGTDSRTLSESLCSDYEGRTCVIACLCMRACVWEGEMHAERNRGT